MTVEEVAAAPIEVQKPVSDVSAKILKQVEFYFGDANLPRDKFMQEKIKENDGWVPISILATFSRMKVLSEDVSVIADALSMSQELLEINEDRTCVRRKTDLPEAADNLTTSVYIKGFALTAGLDDIESFLAGAFNGKIQAIRMRRHPKTKEFKGSVFAELVDAAEAERLASMTLSLPEATEPLIMMVKAKYFEQKNAEKTSKRKSNADEDGEEGTERPFEYTKNCLICVENVPESITFGAIKEALNPRLPVAFADIANGVATVRFKEALPEGDLPESIATFTVGELSMTSRRATEDEEKAYYDAFLASLKAKGGKGKGGRKGNKRFRRN